jgi:hypothetical protein
MSTDYDDIKNLPGLFLTTAVAQILVEKKIISKEEILSKISNYSPANSLDGTPVGKLLGIEIKNLLANIERW